MGKGERSKTLISTTIMEQEDPMRMTGIGRRIRQFACRGGL
jgi:hypothetical protein